MAAAVRQSRVRVDCRRVPSPPVTDRGLRVTNCPCRKPPLPATRATRLERAQPGDGLAAGAGDRAVRAAGARASITASLVVFLIAAGTDWVDGYWARKYGQITQLGRILDPFADKMIICGTFIFLAAAPQLADGSPASGIAAWVAVLVMAREMIVTALRSFVEERGGDFSAKWAGKWKMVFQCAAAAFGIGQLMWYDAATRARSSTCRRGSRGG